MVIPSQIACDWCCRTRTMARMTASTSGCACSSGRWPSRAAVAAACLAPGLRGMNGDPGLIHGTRQLWVVHTAKGSPPKASKIEQKAGRRSVRDKKEQSKEVVDHVSESESARREGPASLFRTPLLALAMAYRALLLLALADDAVAQMIGHHALENPAVRRPARPSPRAQVSTHLFPLGHSNAFAAPRSARWPCSATARTRSTPSAARRLPTPTAAAPPAPRPRATTTAR